MTTFKLKDRYSGSYVWLTLRDGVVVGAMGSDPQRYMGMTLESAKLYAKSPTKSLSENGAAWRADRHRRKYGGVRPGGRNDI